MLTETVTVTGFRQAGGGSSSESSERGSQRRVAPVGKAIMLYEALRCADGALRLSELGRRTGLPKSTTHRLLGELTAIGLVTRLGIGYLAVPRSPSAVRATDRQLNLLRRLAPFVCDAAIRTRCTASLAVLDGPDAAFAHRVYSHENVPTPSDHTGRSRAHLTAAGLLLLSYDLTRACAAAREWGLGEQDVGRLGGRLMSIRRQGFAVRETAGVSCLAVALHAGSDAPPIALAVKGRMNPSDIEITLSRLRAVAAAAAAAAATRARVADRLPSDEPLPRAVQIKARSYAS